MDRVFPLALALLAPEEHGLSQKALEVARPFGFPITNSMVVTWVVALALIVRGGWSGVAFGQNPLPAAAAVFNASRLDVPASVAAWLYGFALIADEIAVEPWILKTVVMPQPKHIRRILLHRWSHGDLYELFPIYRELSPPQVTGGGPLVVPVGQAPEHTWSIDCPCGRGVTFRECHGATE